MTLKEMREKRAKLIVDARAVIELAAKETRAVTDEENAVYDTIFTEAEALGVAIGREEKQRGAERELEEAAAAEAERRRTAGGDPGRVREDADRTMDTFRGWLTTGLISGDGAQEFRDLSAGVVTEGGYLVTPEQFINVLIKAIDDEVVIRRLANVIPMSTGASIGAPSLDNDPGDPEWTTELSTGSNDDDMAFGKRVMVPHPVARRIKISKKLLRVAAMPVEALVVARFAYKFGAVQENAYMIGSGDKRPLGIFTASNDGIPTSRDVSTENTTTKPTANGLINAKYALKAGYWKKATWTFHRDVVKEIAKLVDSNGQYLWKESLRDGEPDRLLGRPVEMSEYAPNTMTTGQYVGVLGDFSNYWILDSLQFQMQQLNELYSETGQTGFIGLYEGDGAPVLAEAFARVTLG